MQRRLFLCSLAGPAGLAIPAFAQPRPLRIIVPFPPGGATDIAGRVLQEPLQRLLGQPVVIDNRAGAGGSIGMAEVARAAGDGLTLGVATLSTHGVNPAVYAKLPYDPVRDFAAVTEIVKAPGVMVIHPDRLAARNFGDLVRYLKAHPGAVSYATPGNGTIGHMWAELFKSSTGVDMVHVPYRGSGPALNDVLAGQVAVYFDQVAPTLAHVKSARLKALAVSWPRRLDVLPDVPTYEELGYAQANEPSWFGLVAPHSTPPSVVRRLQAAVVTALKEPAVRERLAAQGLYASGSSPEDFSRQIAREIDKMKRIADIARIRID